MFDTSLIEKRKTFKLLPGLLKKSEKHELEL